MRILEKSNKIISLICVLIIIGNIFFVPSGTAAFKYLQEGMTAPSIKGNDIITGNKISSEEYLKDNVVVITFWATWSSRSLQQLADLKTLAEKYRELPLKIMAVNVENQFISPVLKDKINQTAAEMELPFPVLIDKGLESFNSFGVIAVPSTAVLDTSGILRYAPSGYSLTTKDHIVDTIEVLLGLKKPSAESVLVDGYIPDSKASRYYNLALQLANQRMWSRALSNLDQAQQADSNFSAPYNLRGQILLETSKPEQAISEFETAVAMDSSSIAARAGLGRALLKNDQLESAFDILSEVLAVDSTYTPAVLDLAICLSEKNDIEKALSLLLDARELNPMYPDVHYYLGAVYLKAGRKADALDSFRSALEILYPSP
ncbi:MAG: tetratricopeptide repeat protein [candidate division Zixibacteria bacterium]